MQPGGMIDNMVATHLMLGATKSDVSEKLGWYLLDINHLSPDFGLSSRVRETLVFLS